MPVAFRDGVLDPARDGDGLQLALVLESELPTRQMVDEQDRADRLGREDLHDGGRAGEIRRAQRDVEIDLVHVAERPAAGDRNALPVLDVARLPDLPVTVMSDMEAGTEKIGHLILVAVDDRLLERDEIGTHLAEAGN